MLGPRFLGVRRSTCASVLVLFLVGTSAACGSDPLPAELARYCELSEDLDQRGNDAFSQLATDASADDQLRVLRSFLEENRADLDELERVAPEAIKEDLAAVIAAQRRAAETGNLGEIEQAAEQKERVESYESGECFPSG